MTAILIVPGFENSGPEHWQTWLQGRWRDAVRVQQRDWFDAQCDEWVAQLERDVARSGDDVVLVGHSCGTMTIAFWGTQFPRKIKGALMVAPTDAEQPNLPTGIRDFRPIPRTRLPFPAIVVASRNDPWMAFPKASELAQRWGADLIDAGNAGHINTASGYGPWEAGESLLRKLL
jgi:predicted alpha/beta hydrolase family esterase